MTKIDNNRISSNISSGVRKAVSGTAGAIKRESIWTTGKEVAEKVADSASSTVDTFSELSDSKAMENLGRANIVYQTGKDIYDVYKNTEIKNPDGTINIEGSKNLAKKSYGIVSGAIAGEAANSYGGPVAGEAGTRAGQNIAEAQFDLYCAPGEILLDVSKGKSLTLATSEKAVGIHDGYQDAGIQTVSDVVKDSVEMADQFGFLNTVSMGSLGKLADKVVPGFTEIHDKKMQELNDKIDEITDKTKELRKNILKKSATFVAKQFIKAKRTISKASSYVRKKIKSGIKKFTNTAKKIGQKVIHTVINTPKKVVKKVAHKVVNTAKGVVRGVKNGVKKAFNAIGNAFRKIF